MTKRILAVLLAVAAIGVFASSARGTTDGLSDAAGDVAEPKADILSSAAAYTDGQITLTTSVASPTNPSTDPNWNNNQSGVGWGLDTNGDGTVDFAALYGKPGAGVFLPDQTLKCQASGSYSPNSQPHYTVTFPASCINSPASIRFAAGMRYFNGTQVNDFAPDNQQVCCSVSNTNTPAPTSPTTTPGSPTTTTPGSPTTTTPTAPTTTAPPTTATTQPPVPGAQITTGAGQGGAPHVQKFDSNGTAGPPAFYAYGPSNTGGVPVARGDLTNDPGEEIVVGSGRGGAFSVFKADGSPIFSGTPFGAGFGGGIEVAVGDVTGSSANEIIVAAGAGGGPHVRVLNADGTAIGNGFFAYGANFTGGVHVAVGRISGAGKSQIVTGAGPGGAPHVRAFDAAGVSVGPGFYAYGLNFGGGVYVAVADSDVITGAGPGAAPHVRSFDLNGAPKASFYAYPETFPGGVRVAAADLGGASGREIITGAGPGGAPHVRVFTNAGVATPTSFYAYGEAFRGGVFVSGSPR